MDSFLRNGPLQLWKQVASKAKDAVIFIDNHCAECLHWSAGGDILFDAGAKGIKEFSSFESGSEGENKALFIVSSPLIGKTAATIQDIIVSSEFKECIVITCLAVGVHQYAASAENTAEGEAFFEKLENDMLKWMDSRNAVAAVIHLPLFVTPVFDNLFLTPSFDMLFPVQRKDLMELGRQGEGCPSSLSDLHFYMLPPEYRLLIRMLSSSFRNYLHILGCKEEIFALGATSHVLAVQLSNLLNHQKTAYPNQVGILFVDRTQDLIGPVLHSEKSLIDQILSILPGLPGHYNNVAIDMSLICNARCEEDDDLVYSGCLVPDQDEPMLLSECYHTTSQDAVTLIIDKLHQAIADEDLHSEAIADFDEKNPAEHIKNLVSAFKENPGAILYSSTLLQFGLAVSQMMSDPVFVGWNSLATLQKLVIQQMGEDSSSSAILQIINFLESSDEDALGFDDMCNLLVLAAYAFKSSIAQDTYERLCSSVCNRISQMAYDELPEGFVSHFDLNEGDLQNKGRLLAVVYRIMNMIYEIDANNLTHFKIIKFSDVEPPSYTPLLGQLLKRIFDPAKPELEPDIEHISTGRKDLLKMGISMFRKITPPRPCDYQTLVVYVIGGITASEVAQMNEVLRKHTSQKCKVIIGSNRLVSPVDIVDKALFSDNLNPDLSC